MLSELCFFSGDSVMSQILSIHRKIERQYLEISHTCHGDHTVSQSTAGGLKLMVFA